MCTTKTMLLATNLIYIYTYIYIYVFIQIQRNQLDYTQLYFDYCHCTQRGKGTPNSGTKVLLWFRSQGKFSGSRSVTFITTSRLGNITESEEYHFHSRVETSLKLCAGLATKDHLHIQTHLTHQSLQNNPILQLRSPSPPGMLEQVGRDHP